MTSPPDIKLAELLRELFDIDELRRFLRCHYREVVDALPTELGLLALAYAGAEALARRNLIDDVLFARLRDERPRCSAQIVEAARRYRAAVHRVRSRRITAVRRVAAMAGGAGMIVMTVFHLSAGAPECDPVDGCARKRDVGVPASPVVEPAATPTGSATPRCGRDMVLIPNGGAGLLCLDRSEVTRAQFCSFAPGAAPCTGRAAQESSPKLPVTHVRPQEAAAYCHARGLRLPRRGEYVEVLRLEIGGRTLSSILPAMNVCGEECVAQPDRHEHDFVHRDPHQRAADVGSYRHAFASPLGLDDTFGNVREIVTDAEQYFACGSGWLNAQLADLRPEICLDAENRPLATNSSAQTVGFRCAGEPTAAPL